MTPCETTTIHASYPCPYVFLKIFPRVDGSTYIWFKSKSAAKYSTYFLSKVEWMIFKVFLSHSWNYFVFESIFLHFQYTSLELKMGYEQI